MTDTEQVWSLVKPEDGPCYWEQTERPVSTVTTLYKARVQAHLGLTEVAAQLGIPPRTLGDWEHHRGWPEPEQLRALWRILRASPHYKPLEI